MKLRIDKTTVTTPIILLIVFVIVAIWRYSVTGKVFYLFNFGYLGIALSMGMFLSGALPKSEARTGRIATMLLVGLYLLLFVGGVKHENLQIEGFWIYLFSGIFAGATLHYFIAKIFGTMLFNRGWCGWACWSAMIFDLLPFREPSKPLNKRWMNLRYLVLGGSFLFAVVLYVNFDLWNSPYRGTVIELSGLIIGNLLYFGSGIILAFILRDNRAFCKYLCPIAPIQKIGASVSLMKMEIDPKSCIDCGKCERSCPMQIKLLDYKNRGERICSTECILCQTCENVCPVDAVSITVRVGKR